MCLDPGPKHRAPRQGRFPGSWARGPCLTALAGLTQSRAHALRRHRGTSRSASRRRERVRNIASRRTAGHAGHAESKRDRRLCRSRRDTHLDTGTEPHRGSAALQEPGWQPQIRGPRCAPPNSGLAMWSATSSATCSRAGASRRTNPARASRSSPTPPLSSLGWLAWFLPGTRDPAPCPCYTNVRLTRPGIGCIL